MAVQLVCTHTFARPVAPQVWPEGQAPQSMLPPQPLPTVPQ
jgi:hypothetical protein